MGCFVPPTSEFLGTVFRSLLSPSACMGMLGPTQSGPLLTDWPTKCSPKLACGRVDGPAGGSVPGHIQHSPRLLLYPRTRAHACPAQRTAPIAAGIADADGGHASREWRRGTRRRHAFTATNRFYPTATNTGIGIEKRREGRNDDDGGWREWTTTGQNGRGTANDVGEEEGEWRAASASASGMGQLPALAHGGGQSAEG